MARTIHFNAGRKVYKYPDPLPLENALNAETIIDLNSKTENAIAIKASVAVSTMRQDQFRTLVRAMPPSRTVEVQVDSERYGAAVVLGTPDRIFMAESLFDGSQPYAEHVNNFEDRYRHLFAQLDLNKWLKVQGVLPIAAELCRYAPPKFMVLGKGARHGLSRQPYKFGLFYYQAIGRERWTLLPRHRTSDLANKIKQYLRLQSCPSYFTECAHFLQHGKLYFDVDYLKNEFGAVTVELAAGECLLIPSDTFFQVESLEPGFSIRYNFVPRRWLNYQAWPDCPFTPNCLAYGTIQHIREVAVTVKNSAVQTLLLSCDTSIPVTTRLHDLDFEQRIFMQTCAFRTASSRPSS